MLDLGCHPGAWLQVACQSLGPQKKGGLVLGIDIQNTTAPPRYTDDRVKIVQADAREIGTEFWAAYHNFDVVLSDMCHFTHGNSVADAFKSLELARTAYEIATMQEFSVMALQQIHERIDTENINDDSGAVSPAIENGNGDNTIEKVPVKKNGVLRPGGSLVMKILQGQGTQEFAQELKTHFNKVAWHRPKATRSESKEVFLLGISKK